MNYLRNKDYLRGNSGVYVLFYELQDLQLGFFNFSVEGCSDCSCDVVKVYNGTSADEANLLKTLCGSLGDIVPDPTSVSGADLYVTFDSNDYATNDRGFLARVGYVIDNTGMSS